MEKVASRHVTWVDVENPTEAEIKMLSLKHMIHPLAAREMQITTYRPKLERYEEHLYLVLHFPVFEPKASSSQSREIDFLIFPYTLVTVHYEPIPQLDDYQKLLAEHEAIRERTFGSSSGHLLYNIISQLFAVSRKDLDFIESKIKNIEERVFNGDGRVLREIALLRRDILNFQKALKPQQTVLDSLEEHGKQFFGQDMKPYFSDIKGAYIQIWNSVENLRETLDTLYETITSLIASNTNEIIKTLTVFTLVVMPISLIAFIFSMDIPGVPLKNNPNAFWIVTSSMIGLSLIIYNIFKQKKWL